MALAGDIFVLALAAVVLLMSVLSVLAWQDRRKPGVFWFAVHTGVVAVWTFVALLGVIGPQDGLTVAATMVANGISVLTALTWFFFITSYLGYGGPLSRRTRALVVAGIGGPILLMSATSAETGFYVTEVTVERQLGWVVVASEPGPGLLLSFAIAYTLFFAGLGFIVHAALGSERLSGPQSILLGVALLIPMVVGLFPTFGFVPTGLPVIQLATGVSAGLYTVALWRYGFLELVPATERIGIEQAFNDLAAGVVVADDDDVVLEVNQQAAAIVGRARGTLLGSPLTMVLDPLGVDATDLPTTVERRGEAYQVRTSTITNDDGVDIGRAVLFTDVTARRERQQRIDVLNRVLRHNLRNKLTIVRGSMQTTAARVGEDVAEDISRAVSATDELLDLSRKARAIERAVRGARDETTVDVGKLVRHVVRAVVEDAETAPTFSIAVPDACSVVTDEQLLELVLVNVVENAVEHTDSDTVLIEATQTDGGVRFVVTDDGPGIPDTELTVIERGEETPLSHGSGLGLWIIDWAVARLDGTVTFDTDADGTRVTVTVPDGESPPDEAVADPTERRAEG